MTPLAEKLVHALETHSTDTLVEGPAGEWTGGALLAAVRARLAALAGDGIRTGEPVIVPVDNRPQDLVDLLAVWIAGGVAVPVHRATPADLRAGLERRLGARLALDRAPDVQSAPDRPLLDGASTIVFTSGSTGEPKGVVLRADRQADKLDAIGRETGWGEGGRTLLALQLTFSFGQWVTLLTLLRGGTLVFPERLSVEAVTARLARGDIDRFPAVPTLLRGVLAQPAAAELTAWQGVVMAGGEVLPASLGGQIRKAWPGAGLGDIYGLSETGTSDFYVDPWDYDSAAGTIGRPGQGIEVRLAADGELRIRSPWGMAGYLDAPEATAAALAADGYFRTGDLAERGADGRYRIVGRAKELINRGGLKVAPLEVEAALSAHPQVHAALVTGIPDDRTGEAVVAAIVSERGFDPAELRDWLAGRIEGYKIPSRIVAVEALPTGRTGKADRGALARLLT